MNKTKKVADHVFDMVDRLDSKLSKAAEMSSFEYVCSRSFFPSRQMQITRTLKELKNVFCRFEGAREDE
jgi:hypothetical protein